MIMIIIFGENNVFRQIYISININLRGWWEWAGVGTWFTLHFSFTIRKNEKNSRYDLL